MCDPCSDPSRREAVRKEFNAMREKASEERMMKRNYTVLKVNTTPIKSVYFQIRKFVLRVVFTR